MVEESWDWSYLNMEFGDQRITLKILHYQSKMFKRSWYRIYDYDVIPAFEGRESVINKTVGYGDTFEDAVHKFIEKRNARSA
jgi:hypothetical protein